MASGERHEWGDWLRAQFDRHSEIRIPADLARASGNKANGRPVIDPSTITQWLRGRRPSYELASAAARAFGAPIPDALIAAGYSNVTMGGRHTTVYEDGSTDSTQLVHVEHGRPVGLGLDDEAAELTPEQIESVRAVIRAMKPSAP